MNTDITAGDTVKLKRRYAASLSKRSGAGVDWIARRGIVKRIGVRGTSCAVIWAGNKGPDQIPIGAVEKCQ